MSAPLPPLGPNATIAGRPPIAMFGFLKIGHQTIGARIAAVCRVFGERRQLRTGFAP